LIAWGGGGDIILTTISPVDFGKTKLLLKKNILRHRNFKEYFNEERRKVGNFLIKKREI